MATSPRIDVLPSAVRSRLLDAVPSFGPVWESWLSERVVNVEASSNTELTERDVGHEFLTRLAWHLGKRVAAGETHEAGWLFGALEPVLRAADEPTWNALTVGFLESLIHAVEREGGDTAVLARLATGPETATAWRTAFEYIHPPSKYM